MALDGGGGGGGGPVGVSNSFTGPAEALEIIGDHIYAYSGEFGASTSSQTLISATTGNYYAVVELTVCGPVEYATPADGRVTNFRVQFNGTTLFTVAASTSLQNSEIHGLIPMIIPPYTEVKIEGDSSANDSQFKFSCIITGRIYRTRD